MDANKPLSAESGPRYLDWRGELLAKLALSRLPGITVVPQPMNGRFDFEVAAGTKVRTLLEVKSFSSIREKIREIESIQQLRWRVPTTFLRNAQSVRCPVVLFVFDADTGHGRYLRVDNIKIAPITARFQTVRLPIENTITGASLRRMLKELGNT